MPLFRRGACRHVKIQTETLPGILLKRQQIMLLTNNAIFECIAEMISLYGALEKIRSRFGEDKILRVALSVLNGGC